MVVKYKNQRGAASEQLQTFLTLKHFKIMTTIQDLKEKLFYSKWDNTDSKNLQETHIQCVLKGKKIHAQFVCVNDYGSMYDCGIFTSISSKGFEHLFDNSNWFNISLIPQEF